MEELVQTLITQLPNIAVAVWVLWQQHQVIKRLLENQERLIERLMSNSSAVDILTADRPTARPTADRPTDPR